MLTFIPDPLGTPVAFHTVEGRAGARVLVVCDHASAAIPASLGDLGVGEAQRTSHVAWDIGAAQVAVILADILGCPAVLSGVSRLVIDCNRQPGDPSSIPALSCGVRVPGNEGVDEAEADARARDWFWPYHTEIGDRIAHLWREASVPAVVAVHSFTPCIEGQMPRPWHVGVLWNRDPRMAEPVLAGLRARGDLVVGDNQPYSGREINYTLDTHAGVAGLPNVSFEIRQDLLADEAGCRRWALILADALSGVLADDGLYRAETY
ncbi:Riorf59 protein [Paramagnetospirillum magnetotacticum MS-1]|uniref:Riorf59 protein n=1 Tax=Paramagnetospirillum magnetotacticum MS-1 TaxID=272627 RepID=A0A0C2YG60_PARME|nr:N-formylglutamate amidohydrolase [Paramagnetospirillum magnetotacticum]KIL98739.1 Riorf59 protein [Paramagnetospirillum magnetotacticum MS-1]